MKAILCAVLLFPLALVCGCRDKEAERVGQDVMEINGLLQESIKAFDNGDSDEGMENLKEAAKRLDKLDSWMQDSGEPDRDQYENARGRP